MESSTLSGANEMKDLEAALRKTEINFLVKNALKSLNKQTKAVFFSISRAFLNDEEISCSFGKWSHKSPQKLPVDIEKIRKKAEKDINKILQNKFGKSPETTIYFVSNSIMEQKGFYW